ncbi:MAG: hypothetical protein M3Y20_03175 [Actinomycetota bacterium]|nr:hypothetical protein [Actinomycetota bacterium]
MSTHRNRYVSAAGAFALAVVLASCTASTPEPSPTPSESATGNSSDLPPVEALQLEVIGAVDDEAWARVENDRFEAVVATCMRDAGFEYTPEEYVPEEDEGDTETLEWARQNGYGISTYSDESDGEDEEYEPTPNDLYLAELSDEELDAYWIAFEGEVSEEGEELDLDELDEDGDGEIDLGDLEEGEESDEILELDDPGYGGCQGVAYDAMAENPLPYDKPEHADVLGLLDEMYAEMGVSDAILDAEEAWIACMAEAGYPDLETTDDASYLVFDAYDAAWEQVPEDAEDIDPELLAPVTELEIAVATADFECRDSAGLDKAYDESQRAAESAFVAEHRDALVAFFEDMGAALEG